jgi:hypothetical protein
MSDTATWLALTGLGAFHGLNPGMGWLFAVALGLQQQSRAAVWRALPPIALGHALAIAVVVAVVLPLRVVVSPAVLRWSVAVSMGGFACYRLWRRRHLRWAGMQVSAGDLVLWSFLMASAHGAGLMLAPLLLGEGGLCGTGLGVVSGRIFADTVAAGIAAVFVHTAAHLAVAAALAIVVYETTGVRVLRLAWFNIDRIWTGVLLISAVVVAAN